MDAHINAPGVDRPDDNENPLGGHDGQSESDWEYEYDETETEDIYVTLDLTSYAPTLSRKRKRGADEPPPPSRTPEAPQASTNAESTPIEAPGDNGQPQQTQELEATQLPTPARPSPPQATPSHQSEIQIFNLASHNPVVNFQGNIYSCTWGSALGTDLLFSIPPPAPPPTTTDPDLDLTAPASAPPPSSPLHQTPQYTLHAATTLRLTAQPAEIIPRPQPTPQHQTQHQPNPQEALPGATAASAADSAVEAAQVDQRSRAYIEPHRRAQVAFLSRLAAVKQAKGDGDVVPLYTNRPNHQPAGGAAGEGDDATPGGRKNRLRRERRWRVRLREAAGDEDEGGEVGEDVDGGGEE